MSGPSTSKQTNYTSNSSNNNVTPNQILQELNQFLAGASHGGKLRNITDVAKSAIYLLKILPASHDAVLEFMYTLFDDAVDNFHLTLELKDKSTVSSIVASHDALIKELFQVFHTFIQQRPKTWASTLTSWSLSLLGNLSAKYAERRVSKTSNTPLPQVLQFWLECPPTKALIELTTTCLTTMIDANDTEHCIDTLLEMAVQHSPHFDWVVAHIGSCFPETVISRVLVCGLKDYCFLMEESKKSQLGTASSSQSSSSLQQVGSTSKKLTAKINSVVGILEHLIAHHSDKIRKSLSFLFFNSLNPSPTNEQLAAIPFILHIASLSRVLAKIIVAEFITAVKKDPSFLNPVAQRVVAWRSHHQKDDLISQCRQLVMEADPQLALTLLDLAAPPPLQRSFNFLDSKVRIAAGIILDCILLEIQHRVLSGKGDLRLLSHLPATALLSVDLNTGWAYTMLQLLCLWNGKNTTVEVIKNMLISVDRGAERALILLSSLTSQQVDLHATLVEHLMQALRSKQVDDKIIVHLAEMVRLEPSSPIVAALPPHIETLATLLVTSSPTYSTHVLYLLHKSVNPEMMSPAALIKLSASVSWYFFETIRKNSSQDGDKLQNIKSAQGLLKTLSTQTTAQHAILRMLLVEALGEKYGKYFGSTVVPSIDLALPSQTKETSLLKENMNIAVSITLPQSHSSVFHAGVIGEGLRKPPTPDKVVETEVAFNKQVLIDTFMACCHSSWRYPSEKPPQSNSDSLVPGMKIVALLLVELISPDVMFNGLPWPDEDFQKVTIERDLHIRRKFDEHPLLWDLLEMVASVPPSLCYCSVLLRALAALLIQYWGGCQHQDAFSATSAKQLATTRQLLDVMALGQLLLPPLGHVGSLLASGQSLSPFELHCILQDVWQYMKANVPSPALFGTREGRGSTMWRLDSTRCDPQYTQRLRHILIANIDRFGAVYAKFFPASSAPQK